MAGSDHRYPHCAEAQWGARASGRRGAAGAATVEAPVTK